MSFERCRKDDVEYHALCQVVFHLWGTVGCAELFPQESHRWTRNPIRRLRADFHLLLEIRALSLAVYRDGGEVYNLLQPVAQDD